MGPPAQDIDHASAIDAMRKQGASDNDIEAYLTQIGAKQVSGNDSDEEKEETFRAFADGGREITATDIEAAAATVSPLSKSAADKLDGLRRWAKEKGARRANADAQTATQASKGRQLDI